MDQELLKPLLKPGIITMLFDVVYTIQPFRMMRILRAAYPLTFVARNEVPRGLYFFERRCLAREKICNFL